MKCLILFVLSICILVGKSYGGTFTDFEEFIPNTGNSIPIDSGGWVHGSFYGTDKWTKTPKLFYRYNNTYNSSNRGWESYGWLEVDNTVNAYNGNSLSIVITGGKNASYPDGSGTSIMQKDGWLASGQVLSDTKIGTPYIFFVGGGNSADTSQPFADAAGTNRLSYYIKMPSDVSSNYTNPLSDHLRTIFDTGPFVAGDTDHYYHSYYLSGGGWIHAIQDNHPTWHNVQDVVGDLPQYKGESYNSSVGMFYLAGGDYESFALPMHKTYLDNINFINVTGNYNHETINSPAVGFYPSDGHWEISFNDEYGTPPVTALPGGTSGYATYEVRYSFSPITELNFASATPISVIASPVLGRSARADGRFFKPFSGYQGVWAAFNLLSADQSQITANKQIYFAIKDISQNPSDTGNGIYYDCNPSLDNELAGKCRNYVGRPDDYSKDAAVAGYVHQIDYIVSPNFSASGVIPGSCGPSSGLALSSAPVIGLCSAGTASAVSGTGPWSWTCAGSGGGSTASCSATLLEIPSGGASAVVACPVMAGFR